MSRESDIFTTPVQRIPLRCIPEGGLVLDIGGGGEGLVSRLEGERVCAVDILLNKIREAQIYGVNSQWVQGDARALGIRNVTFGFVTCWFSLSYLPEKQAKHKVLRETHRVLKREGLLSIMGINILENTVRHVFNAEFVFPDGYISKMSYAVSGTQDQTMESLINLGEEIGFTLQRALDHEYWFEVTMKKT